MQRRAFLETLAASTVAGTFAAASRPKSQPNAPPDTQSRPDVLFILTDQWNPRCLGYAGEAAVRTPNLDRLAAE
jgi:DNA replicative helicase MCM subunit Mcm2 (Cdc46/Mcm family)